MSVCNEALSCLIRQRLMQDWRIASLAVDICCSDGHVALRGMVDTPEQKRLLIQLVSGMIGVRNVKDELTIRVVRTYTGSNEDYAAY